MSAAAMAIGLRSSGDGRGGHVTLRPAGTLQGARIRVVGI